MYEVDELIIFCVCVFLGESKHVGTTYLLFDKSASVGCFQWIPGNIPSSRECCRWYFIIRENS